jgi:hypothetical protein
MSRCTKKRLGTYAEGSEYRRIQREDINGFNRDWEYATSQTICICAKCDGFIFTTAGRARAAGSAEAQRSTEVGTITTSRSGTVVPPASTADGVEVWPGEVELSKSG